MLPIFITARDLPDAWFLALHSLVKNGNIYTIDKGSFEGQKRLEFDHITIHIKYPSTRPLLPDIPPQYGIPNPVSEDYLNDYLPYLMTDKRNEEEEYTYGQRLTKANFRRTFSVENGYKEFFVNQIDKVIEMFKSKGFNTNQACMEVGEPNDITLSDPPCLRLIDCRISDNKLHFIIYFRSWDLYSGFPANLAAIQMLKEYMAVEIGVDDGEMIVSSKGLHVYDYVWSLVETITCKKILRD